MKPSVDVIILSWNRPAETVEAIHSALSQQGVDVRVQVVDQGSDAPTRDALEQLARDEPRVAVTWLERNLGAAGGRNVAIAAGQAPYIVGLDNDAVFESPTTVLSAIDELERSPGTALLSFRVLNYTSRDDDELSWAFPRNAYGRRREPMTVANFCAAGFAMRREAFEQAGGFDERVFIYHEELDLSIRLVNLGYELRYWPEARVLHKVSPERRVDWRNGRYYFFTRNKIYIAAKYGSLLDGGLQSAAYVLKGALHGTLSEAVRGVRDAAGMVRALPASGSRERPILTPDARRYLDANDRKLRGTWLDRVRVELLRALPR